jgi:hypothetical protein
MVRLFTACHGTQLLVIQHLRRHLQLPETREFLIWHPYGNAPAMDGFMQTVISTAGFADTLDMRDFASLRPRTQGPLAWWLESPRRLRCDAAKVRRWMEKNRIGEHEVELWADDPIHFNVFFLRGLLQKSHQVKFPHCFNLEDAATPEWKAQLEQQWRATPWPKKAVFLPWQRWTTGVDLRMERTAYERAYTFDYPSSWAADSIDLSHLISIEAFDRTYQSFPAAARAEVETMLAPIRAARKPLVLLLLFGLGTGPELRRLYERALERIFSERSAELRGCALAVKVHPGGGGAAEQALFDWLEANIPARVFPITHALNLEFMLPQLRPDYVLAGLCGALPIVKRLNIGRPIALSELTEAYAEQHPAERQGIGKFLTGIEVW